MKIAIIGSKDYDSLEYHLNDSLLYLGHEVYHIDIKDVVNVSFKYNYWSRKLFPAYDQYLFSKISTKVIDFKPDLVIGTYRFIHPDCITNIKKSLPTTTVIHINPDQLTTLEHQQIFASPYDAYFTKDRFMVDFMKNKLNLNTFYLPEAFNVRVHKPSEIDREVLEKEIDIDVVAFGTMYPYRARLISELIKKGINISLFGTPDKRCPRKEIESNFKNEFITGERKAKVLLGSKIVLNNFHFAEIQSANVKFFEIGGIGAFQICDYKPVLQEYTEIDVAKFTFKNINEANDLINYYIDKPNLRHQMAEEQRIYFLNNHTYEIRLNQMLNLL